MEVEEIVSTEDNENFETPELEFDETLELNHVPKCRCEKCGYKGRGRHVSGCLCDSCANKKVDAETSEESQEDFLAIVEPFIIMGCEFFDSRFEGMKGYKKITSLETSMLSRNTANVLKKHDLHFKYAEEFALVLSVVGIFGSRLVMVKRAQAQEENEHNQKSQAQKSW